MKNLATLFFCLILSQYADAIEPDTAFNNQFRQDIGGWIAADATFSILLPDGRTLWLFGDTFLGEVNPDNSIKNGSKMIRNSAVIQKGELLKTLYSGTASDPADFLPTQHPDSTWYWPEHGIIEDDSLRIFVAKFRSSENGAPGFNFAHAGNDIAVLTYPELKFVYASPIIASGINEVLYGDRILEDTTYSYIYGRKSDPEFNITYPHVARALRGSVIKQEWEYFDGTGWSSSPSDSRRMNNFQVSQQYSVSTYMGKYVLLTQDIWLSPEIYSFTSNGPAGPWSNKRHLYTTPETSGDTWTYNAYVHPQFDKNGEMLVSYNVNGDFWSIFSNVETYRPRFIRVPYMNLDYSFWPSQTESYPGMKELRLKAYPNPVIATATIEIFVDQPSEGRIELKDTRGTILIRKKIIPDSKGIHLFSLEMESIPVGVYFCQVYLNNTTATLQLIKTTLP
ncbi:MAG: T9SS type A sorting domain-containing protein [Bacteroidales bacterium]|nr:T9SS type A sorting domain-containing protein [Bacteroidales bacterium]